MNRILLLKYGTAGFDITFYVKKKSSVKLNIVIKKK